MRLKPRCFPIFVAGQSVGLMDQKDVFFKPTVGNILRAKSYAKCAVSNGLTDYLIGTGGWAYFHVPGLRSLTAYSRLFNFVEVNSTFYQIPNLKTVESWRRQVQPDFEFSVRCNKDLTHKFQFQPAEEAFKILREMTVICETLKAEILHMQTPPSFQPTKENARSLDSFISSADLKNVRIALEVRGSNQALPADFIRVMQDYNMIHSIDLSNDEEPAYNSDVLYTRLFGKGTHNIYQPTDQELRKIDDRASSGTHKKAIVSFHFVRMYQDARRLKLYKETSRFPTITRSTGLISLMDVLKEDAQFPSSRQELIEHQGWKLFDLTSDNRIRASEMIQKLPERTYENADDVAETLRRPM